MMNIILLSGGSGKRLWPLSNDIYAKQFIKLFRNGKGDYESMLQRNYRMLESKFPDSRIVISTAKSQVSVIRGQLGEQVELSVEPCRRDTFPAIALACAYLSDELGASSGETVVVCPVDAYVDASYFDVISEMSDLSSQYKDKLILMGIAPTSPSEKYGYILPETDKQISLVKSFREKPNKFLAEDYIRNGGLWNAGVFSFRLDYILETMRRLLPWTDYFHLYEQYAALNSISFDYAVVEQAPNILVNRFHGNWMDIGTWNTLVEVMEQSVFGIGEMDEVCDNVHIVNQTDLPVLAMGIKNAVISASAQGILVSDLGQSSYIKPYIEKMAQPVMFTEKSWGSYRVLDVGEESLTIKVILNPGHHMNYHSHQYRDEVWTVISGTGRIIVDEMEQHVHSGDVITIQAGCRHTVIAETKLIIMEVQLGKEISVHDKRKYPLPSS